MRHQQALDLTRAYQDVFFDGEGRLSDAAIVVMRDLERYGCQTRTTSVLDDEKRVDPYAMAINEGKRMAFLHIRKVLFADVEALKRQTEVIND